MTNTKYWIISASKEHVKIGVNGSFGQACHGKSAPLKRMKKGDYLIYYSGKEYLNKSEKCQKFTAIGQVKDDRVYQIQLTPKFCPARIDIEFLKSKDISIIPLINDLNFIKNKKYWGYPFRWGILQIDKSDFDLIANLMLCKDEQSS